MTYKYSRKEIVSKLKEMGLYHDRLEEYILAKSTKQKSTGKDKLLGIDISVDGKSEIYGYFDKGKTVITRHKYSRPKPNKIENTNFWKGHTESQLNQMWEKQCEIIQVINYLLEKER